MHNFMLASAGIQTEPLRIALYGVPTAVCAFLIHAYRLGRMDRQLAEMLGTATPASLKPSGAKK